MAPRVRRWLARTAWRLAVRLTRVNRNLEGTQAWLRADIEREQAERVIEEGPWL